jgi:hypothetical protein
MWGIFMRLILGGIQLILNKLTLQIMINKWSTHTHTYMYVWYKYVEK